MKTILITGGCGFVGRHLLARLAADGDCRIWLIDDLSTGKHPRDWERPVVSDLRDAGDGTLHFTLAGTGVEAIFLQANFMPLALAELGQGPSLGLATLPRFDEVYHLASVVGGRKVIDNDPLAVGIDLGIDATFWLWAAKVNRPGRVLYASSSAAYPIHLQAADANVALAEPMIDFGDILGKPDYTYGWSKLTGEYLGRIAVEKYGLKVGVVRPFSGYGEDQEPVYPFPAIALRVAARHPVVKVWGSGQQGRDFVHIDDACEACVRTCRRVEDGSAVNIGWGRLVNFLDLAKLMIEREGYDARVEGVANMPVGVAARFCDPAHMRATLDWFPQISLEAGVDRALAFARGRLARGVEPE